MKYLTSTLLFGATALASVISTPGLPGINATIDIDGDGDVDLTLLGLDGPINVVEVLYDLLDNGTLPPLSTPVLPLTCSQAKSTSSTTSAAVPTTPPTPPPLSPSALTFLSSTAVSPALPAALSRLLVSSLLVSGLLFLVGRILRRIASVLLLSRLWVRIL